MLSLTYSLADQDFFTTKSVGIFNLSVQLLKALAEPPGSLDLEVLLNSTLRDQLNLPRTIATRLHDEAIGGRIRRVLWDQWGVYRAGDRPRKDWLFLPKGFASFVRICPLKLALYVHDAILEGYYGERPGVSSLERLYFARCLGASLKQARVIFTNSDFTCRELDRAAARRGMKPPRVVNVGIGFEVPPAQVNARLDQVLVLSGAFPHKRTDLALEYLARWQRETKYAGSMEWVGRLPSGLSLPEFTNWRHNIRLSEAEYRDQMRRSRALVFFSDYEGFGMPPVEAILGGLCPVYSNIEATREIMAGAGCSFQNDSYESFARALQAALAMPMGQIELWGQFLSRRFNWARVRTQIIETLIAL